MLARLLALAILAIVAYYALTQGVPWLKQEMAGQAEVGPDASESELCVFQASTAAEAVGDELLPNARPPVDTTTWGSLLVRVAGSLATAENACACPTAACASASDAIRELRALFDQADEMARGNPMGIGNPARRMERAYELLDRARDQVGSG